MQVDVVPYDDAWPGQFAALERDLRTILAKVDVEAIEHVGSTSVPGLAAKPVIDVDIVVAPGEVGAATDALVAAGYGPLGTLGIPERNAFVAPDARPERRVYVTIAGSLALRNHLAVRDTLRADPELRDQYGELKLFLAKRTFERSDQYVAAKSPILQRILRAGGLSDDELAEIEHINRLPDPEG